MYCILIYDIDNLDGSKVSRHVFKIAKKYLIHIQKSVFEGELSDSQYNKMYMELKKELRKNLDSCIVFKNSNAKWLEKEFITDFVNDTDNFI